MRLLAPAKINLHLRVGGRDAASGYHPVVSWMCTVGLFDTLTIRPDDGAAAATAQVTLTCDDPKLPCDASNLVTRAAAALQREVTPDSTPGQSAAPPRIGGAQIALQKRIPMGGGLGGGSSDAARALLGLNRAWRLDLPLERLHAIAARLGSDVPFFLHGPSSACTGRGEVVRPVARPRVRAAVLILPGVAVATPDVYRKFDELRLAARDLRLGDVGFEGSEGSGGSGGPQGFEGSDAQPPWQEWAELSAGPLLARLRNDLEPAAFSLVPQLGRLRDSLEQSLARVIRMTGSGGTLFTLFDERHEADVAAQFVRVQHMLEALAVDVAPRVSDDLSNPE